MGRIGGAGAPSGPMPTPKGMSFGQTNGKRDVGALYFPIRRGSLVVSHIHTSLSPRLCSQGSALDLGSFRTGRYFSGYRSATSSGWILLWPDCGAQHTLEEISVLDNPAIRHPKTLIKRNCQAIALLVLSSSAFILASRVDIVFCWSCDILPRPNNLSHKFMRVNM